MPILAPFARLAVAGSLLLALAACDFNGVGDGNKLERLEILRGISVVGAADNTAYLCFSESLQLVGVFSNGSRGDYTARAKWTSDNPAVVNISNGDITLPDDDTLAYRTGTLLPMASGGSTTIRAEFVGLTATYPIEVKAPTAITIEPQSQSMALNTAAGVTLKATIEGEERDVTQVVLWKFAEEDTEDLATIGVGTGVVIAKKEIGTVTAVPRFVAGCPGGLTTGKTAAVNIRNLQAINIERQFTSAPNNELILGTSDRFSATGSFAGTAETQDLSAQIPFASTDAEVVLALTRTVSAIKVGTANVTGVYTLKVNETPADDVVVTSNAVPIAVVDRALDSIAVTPATATIEAITTQQFNAVGTFSAGGVSSTQDITRHVAWTTSDSAVVAIGNGVTLDYGMALSLKNETTTTPIVITATRKVGTGDTAVDKTGTAALSVTAIPEEEAP